MEYADKAEALFRDGLNCSQAVAGAFSDLFAELSETSVLQLTSVFGGGFARKRELCGAVSGMGIVYGLLLGTHTAADKMDTYARSAAFIDRFIALYGSIVCSELLDKTPDSALAERRTPLTEDEKNAYHWPCIDYVRSAARLTGEYLAERGIVR